MPRIRTIKPQFWSDATIVSLPFEYRLLFQGLWNFADDKGFIENRPAQIKLDVFPADDVDIAKGVRALKKAGLIEIVKLEGKSVIRILNWQHQRIDKPQPSVFAEQHAAFLGRSQNVPGTLPPERKGREGKGREVTQVGGGGHLGSAPPATTADLAEPWRCPEHQGVDVPCLACKAAKKAHRESEAAATEAVKHARVEADRAPARERAAERERVLAEIEADPEAVERLKAEARAAIAKTDTR